MKESKLMKRAREILEEKGVEALWDFLSSLAPADYTSIRTEAFGNILDAMLAAELAEMAAEVVQLEEDRIFRGFSVN